MPCQDCSLPPERYHIVLDFDGVIHSYERGLHDGSIYGELMPGFLDALAFWRGHGHRLAIMSCREPESIKVWLAERGITDIPVLRSKPVGAVYVDDKGYRFVDWSQEQLNSIQEKIDDIPFYKTKYGQDHVG